MTETPDPFAPPPVQPPVQPPAPPPPPAAYPPSAPVYQAPPPGYQAPPPGYPAPPAGYPAPPPPGYPPAYGAPPGGYPGQQPAGLPSGLAIAALIVGIVACLGFWVPFGGVLLGILALVLGIVAWRKASTGRGGGKAMAVIGTILGSLAIIGGIIATIFIVWFVRTAGDCFDSSFTEAQRQACIDDTLNQHFETQ